MINFRFHIVSLTAVLLALGIGLVLGTTILDTATVDVLRSRLEGLDRDLDEAEERNNLQQQLIGDFQREADELREQAGERLYAGELAGAPVLVIAPRDVDGGIVDQVMAAVQEAGGDLRGTWWLTERLALAEEGDVSDLGTALELATTDTDRLHDNLVGQLGDILFGASDAADEPPGSLDPGAGEAAVLEGAGPEPGAPGPGGAEPVAAEPGGAEPVAAEPGAPGPEPVLEPAPDQVPETEPQVLARLREHGFIDYQLPEGAEGDAIALPSTGLRIVIVSSPDAHLVPGDLVVPVLRDLASGGAVPVVAAETAPDAGEQDDEGDEEEASVPSLVAEIRDDDELSERVATVDNLDRATGAIATILAVSDADPAAPRLGHYGLGEAASHLLPPSEDAQ